MFLKFYVERVFVNQIEQNPAAEILENVFRLFRVTSDEIIFEIFEKTLVNWQNVRQLRISHEIDGLNLAVERRSDYLYSKYFCRIFL